MNICLVGGIYGKSAAFREAAHYTPETLLEAGLRSRGQCVTTVSHYDPIPDATFDVIHVHHLSWGAVRAACHNSSAKFVFTPHDPRAMSALLPPARRFATRFVIARADAVVALSEAEAARQRTTYDLRPARHALIPNGIDLCIYRYSPHAAPSGREPWQVLYVGQLTALKRVDVLLRALAQCPVNVELKLAFHVDTLRPELERLASRLGLGSRVRFLGPKRPPQLAQLYRTAHLLVLPSAGEALPSVITEAMACGIPIVATDVGGVAGQLAGYGRLVHPDNVGELAQTMRQIMANYSCYAGQGEAMSRRAEERFSAERMVAAHIQLYEELLRGRSRPRRLTSNHVLSFFVRHTIELASRWRQPLVRL